MSSDSPSHEQRTATEQRSSYIHRVVLDKIESINEDIRLLQLRIPDRRQIKASLLQAFRAYLSVLIQH